MSEAADRAYALAIADIRDRALDMHQCNKDDMCNEVADALDVIVGYLEELWRQP